MCVFYDFSRSAGLGDAAVDERLKASALVACRMYSCTYVKRHKNWAAGQR